MNEDIKVRWTARLRSGQDEQTKSVLRNLDDGKCCLGVLCEIAVEDGVIEAPYWAEHRDGYAYGSGDEADAVATLPRSVWEWAGLPDANPDAPRTGVTLAALNDKGFTFAQLADLIDCDF